MAMQAPRIVFKKFYSFGMCVYIGKTLYSIVLWPSTRKINGSLPKVKFLV